MKQLLILLGLTSTALAQTPPLWQMDGTTKIKPSPSKIIWTDKQFQSTVTTGTAPFTVTSTTAVTNFNADYLDGQHGAFYQDVGNINAGTLAVANGGTGQNSYTNGQLLIGNTTGNTLAKATLTGTTNQVTVTNGAGSITLATPQDIGTGSTPVFTGLRSNTTGISTNRAPGTTYMLDGFISTGVARLNIESGDASNCTFRFANTTRDWQFSNNGTTGKWSIVDNTGTNTRVVLDTSGNMTVGNASAGTGATNNVVLGAGATTEVLGAATADIIHLGSIDRVNTRHAAAGNRALGVQGERGSAIYLGDDAIDFAAGTGIISVNATDLTITSTTVAMPQKISTYNNIATVSNGVPSELGTADITGQTAAKSATTLYTPAATGMFRVSCYLQVTTAASSSSTLGGATGVVITFTDGDGSVAQSNTMALKTAAGAIAINSAGNATTTNLNGDMIIYAKTGVAVQYAIGYTSSGATAMQYAAHLKIEAL